MFRLKTETEYDRERFRAVPPTYPLYRWSGWKCRIWWAHQDLNLEPKHYECSALTN